MEFIKSNFISYFILFIFTLLLSILLLPEEGVFSKAISTFLTFVFFVTLIHINKILFNVFLGLSFLVLLLFFPSETVYGEIDINFAAATYYTSLDETLSYMKQLSLSLFFILFLMLILTIIIMGLKFKIINKKIVFITVPVLMLLPIKNYVNYGWRPEHIDKYLNVIPLKKSSKLIYLINRIKQEDKYITIESQKPSTWVLTDDTKKELAENFVIVIGESVRKDFMGAYGFSINNTPFMTNSNNILFKNFHAVSSHTVSSLTRTIALSDSFPKFELNNNIVNLANTIGYKTYWLSNQGQIGVHESPITIMAKQADFSLFLNKGNSDNARNDFQLLDTFEEKLNEMTKKPKLIVLHLIGSHPYSCDRTNGEYNQFFMSKDFSCYIESIHNTDKLLEKIYKSLQKKDQSFKMIYFSDHGLRITDDLSLSHGRRQKQPYEVPLVIWTNELEKKVEINANRMANDFLHLFSELNQIKVQNISKTYSFISEEDNGEAKIQVLNSDEKLVDFESLEDNSIQNYK